METFSSPEEIHRTWIKYITLTYIHIKKEENKGNCPRSQNSIKTTATQVWAATHQLRIGGLNHWGPQNSVLCSRLLYISNVFVFKFIFPGQTTTRGPCGKEATKRPPWRGCKAKVKLHKHPIWTLSGESVHDGLSDAVLKITITPLPPPHHHPERQGRQWGRRRSV